MERRGFLGSLAGLVGAGVVIKPTPLIERNEYVSLDQPLRVDQYTLQHSGVILDLHDRGLISSHTACSGTIPNFKGFQ